METGQGGSARDINQKRDEPFHVQLQYHLQWTLKGAGDRDM